MIVEIDPQDALKVQLARERLYALNNLLAKIAAERHAAELAIQLSDTQQRQAVAEKEHLEAEAFTLSDQMAQKYGIEPTDDIDWEAGTITKAATPAFDTPSELVDAVRAAGLPGADTAVFAGPAPSGAAAAAWATANPAAAAGAGSADRGPLASPPQRPWATFGSGTGDPESADGRVREGGGRG